MVVVVASLPNTLPRNSKTNELLYIYCVSYAGMKLTAVENKLKLDTYILLDWGPESKSGHKYQ